MGGVIALVMRAAGPNAIAVPGPAWTDGLEALDACAFASCANCSCVDWATPSTVAALDHVGKVEVQVGVRDRERLHRSDRVGEDCDTFERIPGRRPGSHARSDRHRLVGLDESS